MTKNLIICISRTGRYRPINNFLKVPITLQRYNIQCNVYYNYKQLQWTTFEQYQLHRAKLPRTSRNLSIRVVEVTNSHFVQSKVRQAGSKTLNAKLTNTKFAGVQVDKSQDRRLFGRTELPNVNRAH